MCSALAADPGEDLAAQVGRAAGRTVRRLVPVAGGGNNRLFRADTDDGPLAVKHYPMGAFDRRDRLAVEYGALDLLVRAGLDAVPRPVACLPDRRVGIYDWIDGEPVGTVGLSDIAEMAAFLQRLRALSRSVAASAWERPASAAVFSPAEAVAQVSERRVHFVEASRAFPELADFLTGFDACADDVVAAAKATARATGMNWEEPLPRAGQLLSPSDFGIHNTLRQGGRLVFLDFEYFGWDDPAKLWSDAIIHPGSRLTDTLAGAFRRTVLQSVEAEDGLAARRCAEARLAVMAPLCGLCWCMILLNEFLPERRQRRLLSAGAKAADLDTLLHGQLAKARDLLHRITRDLMTNNVDGEA